ncbi:MAG TPA: hypothetical protein VFR47_13890 [Anaerolineales bacterium]|nr:hypothetical protein [Anaerolineales bacterium]
MSHLSIVRKPENFRNAFFTNVQNRSLDESYEGVISVLLYYIWRGLYNSVTKVIKGDGNPDLVLTCISTYKAFLPLIHLIRMGYTGDTLILLRSLMERIALLGYLNENPDTLGKYKAGKLKLPDEALNWAKQRNLPNWMRLYSLLSNLAHQKQESVAGSIFDENSVGDAIRYMLPSSKPTPSLTDETLALLWFGVASTDAIAEHVLSSTNFPEYSKDEDLRKHVSKDDIQNFEIFLAKIIIKYQ